MYRPTTDQQPMFTAQLALGVSKVLDVESFRNVELQLAQTAFTGTIKFACSNADITPGIPPNFGAAASAANPWDYVRVINLIDGSAVAGGTGVTSTAVTQVSNFEVNTNGIKWIAAIITSYTSGQIDLMEKGYGNI